MSSWIMVTGREAYFEEMCRLGIAAAPVSVSLPRPLSGIAFPEEDLSRVRELFEVSEERVETDFPFTFLVPPAPDRSEGRRILWEAHEVPLPEPLPMPIGMVELYGEATSGTVAATALTPEQLEEINGLVGVQAMERAEPEPVAAPIDDHIPETSGHPIPYGFTNYDEVCLICNFRMGEHYGGRCPDALGRRVDNSDRRFQGSGTYRTTRGPAVAAPASPVSEPVITYTVIKESDASFEQWSEMRPVLVEFAQRLKVNIILYNSHKQPWDEIEPDEDQLRILFWCNADPAGFSEHTRNDVWGYHLSSNQNDGCSASECADRYIVSAENEIVAEVKGRTLFVLFDLPHGANAGSLMRCILEAYANEAEPVKPAEPLSIEELAKKVQILTCGMLSRRIAELKAKSETAKHNISAHVNAIQASTAELAGNAVILKGLESEDPTDSSRMVRELESLKKLDKVVKIAISGGNLVITTSHIDFKHFNNVRVGHSYSISLDPGRGSICIKSADSLAKVDGRYVHPHVDVTGKPCLGNIQKGIYTLLSTFEFAALTQMIIEYLSTANEGDWYINPTRWPLVKDGVPASAPVEEDEEPQEEVERCSHCGYPVDDCECWTCNHCGARVYSDDICSECNRCSDCGCRCEPEEEDEP